MNESPIPEYIIVHDLNKLRWLVPKHCLITNVFFITVEFLDLLNTNNIPFDFAIKSWGDYKIIQDQGEQQGE